MKCVSFLVDKALPCNSQIHYVTLNNRNSDYNNYIDSYDLVKKLTLNSKITFFIYNIGWYRGMKH